MPFLNKKGWHPGSFKNIEQTWIAENEQLEKEKRWEEILKKREEEK